MLMLIEKLFEPMLETQISDFQEKDIKLCISTDIIKMIRMVYLLILIFLILLITADNIWWWYFFRLYQLFTY